MRKNLLITLLFMMCLLVCPVLSACSLFGNDEPSHSSRKNRDDEDDEDEDEEDEDDEEEDEEELWESTYVFGFSAGGDPAILLYEVNGTDMAFLKSGSDEVFGECVIDNAELSDGTEYVQVSVDSLSLGYYEDGGDIYILDAGGKAAKAEEVEGEDTEDLAGDLDLGEKSEKKDKKDKKDKDDEEDADEDADEDEEEPDEDEDE